MLGAATPALAANVTRAGAFGFLAGGTNPEALATMLDQTSNLLAGSPASSMRMSSGRLPIGVGFQLFNSPLDPLAEAIAKYKPAVVWLFAPNEESDLQLWSKRIRSVTNSETAIWIQVGSVGEAERSLSLAQPDVLVLQGNDAGGHGRRQSASVISLVPEVLDMLERKGRSNIPVLAAGGIVDSRGCAAALSLGASGAVVGTRFLVAEESGIAPGWKSEILRTVDGGVTTVRSTLGDRLKRTRGWPARYDGRAIKNKGHEDEEVGMSDSQNIELYNAELKQGDDAWTSDGRMVAWAGSGVGLIKRKEPAATIVEELLSGTTNILNQTARIVADGGERTKL